MSKKSNGKKEKAGLVEFLSVKVGLPCDLLSGELRVELCGRNQLLLHGCRRIIKYSADEMIISASSAVVRVRGKRLICSSFYGGTLSIDGYIIGFEFDDERTEEK